MALEKHIVTKMQEGPPLLSCYWKRKIMRKEGAGRQGCKPRQEVQQLAQCKRGKKLMETKTKTNLKKKTKKQAFSPHSTSQSFHLAKLEAKKYMTFVTQDRQPLRTQRKAAGKGELKSSEKQG